MVNIIKEELPIEEALRKKLELICEFAKTTPTTVTVFLLSVRFTYFLTGYFSPAEVLYLVPSRIS